MQIRELGFKCLIRQDWFNIDLFRDLCRYPGNFTDAKAFVQLRNEGEIAIKNNDINHLRRVIGDLFAIQKHAMSTADILTKANILRG